MPNAILRISVICITLVYALFSFTGCTSQTTAAPPANIVPLPNSVSNFEDIELPSEMKLDLDDTMSVKTDSFRGGILKYSGKVEMMSLRDFVIASMVNNQWKHVGEASYENILLAFTKPNKTCMVVLEEGFGGSLGKTYLTLYITVDVAASKRLNPFGEPIAN